MDGTALVLCEGQLGRLMGKTGNSLVRRSERFEIVGVLDGTNAGRDAGEVLDGRHRSIPVFAGLEEALLSLDGTPDFLILGVAVPGGRVPDDYRAVIREAISCGMGVVSGLHEFLGDDEELSRLAMEQGVDIVDVRRPPPLEELHLFTDKISEVECPRIPVLGTDSSIGKRTTAWIMADALRERGENAVFVATGQTGLMQGARYGVALDAIRGDYMVGELEHQIWLAWEEERPNYIIVEGQGALGHPVYVCGSRAILAAAKPVGVVMQHDPKRGNRHYGNLKGMTMPMPEISEELRLLECLGQRLLGIGLNGMELTDGEVDRYVEEYERRFGVPVEDAVRSGGGHLIENIIKY